MYCPALLPAFPAALEEKCCFAGILPESSGIGLEGTLNRTLSIAIFRYKTRKENSTRFNEQLRNIRRDGSRVPGRRDHHRWRVLDSLCAELDA